MRLLKITESWQNASDYSTAIDMLLTPPKSGQHGLKARWGQRYQTTKENRPFTYPLFEEMYLIIKCDLVEALAKDESWERVSVRNLPQHIANESSCLYRPQNENGSTLFCASVPIVQASHSPVKNVGKGNKRHVARLPRGVVQRDPEAVHGFRRVTDYPPIQRCYRSDYPRVRVL